MTDLYVRTAGAYCAVLATGPLTVPLIARLLGIPEDYAEHDVLKLVELGVLREGELGMYGVAGPETGKSE